MPADEVGPRAVDSPGRPENNGAYARPETEPEPLAARDGGPGTAALDLGLHHERRGDLTGARVAYRHADECGMQPPPGGLAGCSSGKAI